MFCSNCGTQVAAGASFCASCGTPVAPTAQQAAPQAAPQQAPQYAPGYGQQPYYSGPQRVTAGILGIFLGWIGVHKFYCGKIGAGILYLIFFWTAIPAIAGFIEGIVYLAQDEAAFQRQINNGKFF